MRKGQTRQTFIVSGWVEVSVYVPIKAFSREGAMKKAAKLDEEGLVNWDEGNWGSGVTIDGAEKE